MHNDYYNCFINFVFFTIIFVVFIPPYAEISCQQHTVTYHGRVTVHLIFINVIVTALLRFIK